MKILIFGGTGFLGKYIVRELALTAEKIYVVSRSTKEYFSEFKNVELVLGDITDIELIKDNDIKKLIIAECDIIIHAAALYDLKAPYEEQYLHNVVGTQNVVQLIKKMNKLSGFYYISTIAVADDQSLLLDEVHFPERKKFDDNYSKTKYFAEKMIREFSVVNPQLPVRIIRPAVVVGDSKTGEIATVNGPYFFLELFKKYKNILKNLVAIPMPYNPGTELPMIPVDHAAHFINLIVKRDQYSQELKTYHLVCIDPPTIRTFLKDISREFGIKTQFIPMKNNKLFGLALPILKIPKETIPFMFSKVTYDTTLTLKDLPELKDSKYAEFKRIFFLK